MTGNHLVEQCAKTPKVRTLVNVNSLRLLGRHVVRGAHHRPCASVDQGARRRFRIGGGPFCFSKFRQTKIEDLNVAVAPDHHVLWLDVAVNDARCVGGGERTGDLAGHLQHIEQSHAFVHALPQRLAVNELSRNKAGIAGRSDFMNSQNVRMVERRSSLRLLNESLQTLLIGS